MILAERWTSMLPAGTYEISRCIKFSASSTNIQHFTSLACWRIPREDEEGDTSKLEGFFSIAVPKLTILEIHCTVRLGCIWIFIADHLWPMVSLGLSVVPKYWPAFHISKDPS